MAKKQFSVRLRPDQERQMELMLKFDPELDISKIVRKAVDEYLAARANDAQGKYVSKKKGTGK